MGYQLMVSDCTLFDITKRKDVVLLTLMKVLTGGVL